MLSPRSAARWLKLNNNSSKKPDLNDSANDA
jgi:hypothetical protein